MDRKETTQSSSYQTNKAAMEYANSIAQSDERKKYCIEDFEAGAEWAKEYEAKFNKSEVTEAYKAGVKWMKQQLIDKACEWVSTEESLPPLDKDVLVVLPKGEMTVARREKTYSTTYEERWVGAGDIIFLDQLVYYWRELPKPPKMEE